MGISRYSRPVRPLVPCAMPGVPPRTNSGGAASAPVTSGRLRTAIRTTTSTTRRTTRTKETPQLMPRRLRDRDDRTPRQSVSDRTNRTAPGRDDWAAGPLFADNSVGLNKGTQTAIVGDRGGTFQRKPREQGFWYRKSARNVRVFHRREAIA